MPKLKGDYDQISEKMAELYQNSEMSLADIGKKYGVSRQAVALRLNELEIPLREKNVRHKRTFKNLLSKYSEKEKQILYDLYHVFEMSFNQISFYTGINPKTVYTIITSFPEHVSRKNPSHKKQNKNIILGYTKLGFSISDLAIKFEKPVAEILEILGDEIPGEKINIKSFSNSA